MSARQYASLGPHIWGRMYAGLATAGPATQVLHSASEWAKLTAAVTFRSVGRSRQRNLEPQELVAKLPSRQLSETAAFGFQDLKAAVPVSTTFRSFV